MGHIRLGELPRSRAWNQLVEMLRTDGSVEQIAAQALEAAEDGFERAAYDRGLGQAMLLLARLPKAALGADFVSELGQLGVDVDGPPSIAELVGAITDSIDTRMRRDGGRTDLGEMAQMAATETLTHVLAQRCNGLFGCSTADVQRELGKFATKAEFSRLTRDFFARLGRRFLSFYLSRELSNHVGGERRFANVEQHAEFNGALWTHCEEASRVVQDFAGDWFSKRNWEQGTIDEKAARNFSWTALKKMRTEFRRGARR